VAHDKLPDGFAWRRSVCAMGSCNRGCWTTSHRFRVAKSPAGSRPREHPGGGSELVGAVGVPSAEENKKHARHRFLISTAGLWWRVEKPVPEEARLPSPPQLLHAERHDTNTCATPDSQAVFLLLPFPPLHPWSIEQHEAAVRGHATHGTSTTQDSAWSFCVNPSWLL
jgi:hypothetical protein